MNFTKIRDNENDNRITKKYKYDLLENGFSNEDIACGSKVLKSKRITMASKTRKFEIDFAKKIGVKYALMVNSGSSANLLATFAAGNLLRNNHFKRGDEVLIPVLCWPTSLWPLVQFGLKPRFIDIDINTLNVDENYNIKFHFVLFSKIKYVIYSSFYSILLYYLSLYLF